MRLAAGLALLLAAAPAWAILGKTVDTVATDQVRLRAARRVVTNSGYTVHELTATDGSVVREYATPAGVVFAIAWHGHHVPPLGDLLGDYATTYAQALPQRRARGPVHVIAQDLVVTSGGHMGSFTGRAFVPSLLPAGVTPADIQ